MPAFIKSKQDEQIWEDAKKSVDKSKYKDDESYYAVVTSVYKKMGGSIGSNKESLNKLYSEKNKKFN